MTGAVAAIALMLAPPNCADSRLAVSRAAREVFLDPSSATQALATQKVIDSVLTPLQDDGTLAALIGGGCLSDLLAAIDSFGEPGTLNSTYEKLRNTYRVRERSLPEGTSETRRARLRQGESLGRARSATPSAALELPKVEMLLAIERCPGAKSQAAAIIESLEKKQTRLSRLDVALALPSTSADECAPAPNTSDIVRAAPASYRAEETPAAFARRWALNVITADPDPRRWDRTEVVHLVASSRVHAERDDPLAADALAALSRIGRRRAWRLVHPAPEATMYPDLPEHSLVGYAGDARFFHFPFEGELYLSEFESKNPSPVTHSALDNWRLERLRAADARWIETDDAAPHFDLDGFERDVAVVVDRLRKEKPPKDGGP